MKLSLAARMFAALFGVSAVMVALVVAWAGWALSDGFAVYLNNRALAGMDRLAAALEVSYARHGDWAGVAGDGPGWDAALRRQGPPPMVPDWPLKLAQAPPQGGPLQGGPPPDAPGPDAPGGPPGMAPGRPPPGQDFGPPPLAPGLAGFGVRPDRPREPPEARGDPTADYLRPRLALLNAAQEPVAGPGDALRHAGRRVLFVNGRKVGELRFDAGDPPGGLEGAFLAARFGDLYAAGGVALLLSAVAALVISRNILVPVRLIAAGARRLAEGEFGTRLVSARGDELGQLVRDFNALALALESAEAARRRWVADTSHEMRTPLAVLRAQIEALQDGVQAVDARTLGILQAEVARMTRLVGDLHELSRADTASLALQKTDIALPGLVRGVLAAMAPRMAARNLQVDPAGLGAAVPQVLGDAERLRQVFSNILENSLRYTDAGGTVRLSVWSADGFVIVRLEDSAPGVPTERLGRIFERFYRGEESRNRATGGSGLGLAICKSIVTAHGGTIAAAACDLGGLRIDIALPVDKGAAA